MTKRVDELAAIAVDFSGDADLTERVAKALCKEALEPNERWMLYVPAARAAIKAVQS